MRISGGIKKGLIIACVLMATIISPKEIDGAYIKPLKPNLTHTGHPQTSIMDGNEAITTKIRVLSMKALKTHKSPKIEKKYKLKTIPKKARTLSTDSQGWIPMEVQATAYNDRGTMAGGRYVYSGAIAVDPRLIPMGAEVKIEGFSSTFRAEDTGRLIKGHIIDIWMGSKTSCINWGRRTIKIWIKRK